MLVKRLEELLDAANEATAAFARSDDVPPEVVEALLGIRDARTQETDGALAALDPDLVQALDRGLLVAWPALQLSAEAGRRRATRLALEQVRQALRDLTEEQPVSEARTAKETVQWLDEVLDVRQEEMAALLHCDRRQYQRWLSASQTTMPHGDDARRVRLLARVVGHLRHAMTGPGVAAWLRRPHPALDGAAPMALLDDPASAPMLLQLAAAARSQRAA